LKTFAVVGMDGGRCSKNHEFKLWWY